MEETQQVDSYDSQSTEGPLTELFTGKLPLADALNRLRKRLLDLSSRNRLLNYKHPKRRSLQFVDKSNLDLVFARLIDAKPILIKYVPDPPPHTYTTKKPEAKPYAQTVGIDTNTEFSPKSPGASSTKHTPRLQTLYYPADLDRLCRRVASDARTVIEETGTNMLYIVFGFLKWYEREDSEKPMLAPLLAVPVTLEKGKIDQETRTYQYSISYSGEDVHENETLREKLNQEFSMQLPAFEEEDEPIVYFTKIEQAILKKKNWKVKYQLTLGFLSFGKLALWHDLDSKKWPGLLDHPLLNEIFTGRSGKGASFFSSDYEIDNHPQSDLPLIFDADSSQHSAIIDVLSGTNMVINGPPGTGKSQTITNIIAAGLKAGKKILFISDKLAALEVVRHRLNQANLGHFCLELHSHKTQKKKLLIDLQDRINQKFRFPQQLNEKLSTLKRHRNDLNRYAELMGTRVGNEIGLTVHEVFWRTERCRQAIGGSANVVQSFFLSDTPDWTYDDLELRRQKLEVFAQLYDNIGSFGAAHPWWGFIPRPLAPGDDDAISRIISEATFFSQAIVESLSVYREKTDCPDEPSLTELADLYDELQTLPDPPHNLIGGLLPRIVTADDSSGKRNRQLLQGVIQEIEKAAELISKADSILLPGSELDLDTTEPILTRLMTELNPVALSKPLDELEELVIAAEHALRQFEDIASRAAYAFVPIDTKTLENLGAYIEETSPLTLVSQPVRAIGVGASLLYQECTRLSASLDRVTNIANRRDIAFDGTRAAIGQLRRADGINDVLKGVVIDDAVIQEAQRAGEYLHANLPISELAKVQHDLHTIYDRIRRALNEMEDYARRVDLRFDQSKSAVEQLTVLARIAAQAPADLLEYRRPSLARAQSIEIVAFAEEVHTSEKLQRELIAQDYYLDSLPSEKELRAAISVFRRGDSVFNIFNGEWRGARALFKSFSRKNEKRKAADYETQLSGVVSWIRHRESFVENSEFKDAFGSLFKGLETDFSKIRRLCTWYAESHAEMLKHTSLIESVDLSTVALHKILQLANLSPRVEAISNELQLCISEVRQLLGADSDQLELTLQLSGWLEYGQAVLKVADELKISTVFLGRYVSQHISPKRAVDLLKAKSEIQSVSGELEALEHGIDAVQRSIQPLLPGIVSVPCTRWSDYLFESFRLANAARALAEFAGNYGTVNSSLADIRMFLQAKTAVDASIEKMTALLEEESATDWPSYIGTAKRRVRATAELVRLLKPCGKPGTSARTVLEGINATKQATDLISGVSSDGPLMNLLQDVFQGYETDLEALVATLSWSESVAGSIPIRCSPLYSLLLSSEVNSNLSWAKNVLQKIADCRNMFKTTLHRLAEFGSFTWDEWISYGRDQTKDEFASHLLKRNQVAADKIDSVLAWSKYNAQRLNCLNSGLGVFVDAVEQNKLPTILCGKAFEFVTYFSIGRGIYKSFPELEGFEGADHNKKRAEYAKLDREIIGLTGKSFAYEIDNVKQVPAGNTGYRASDLTEMELLRRELNKQRRHLPIRQLLKRSGRAILALKPCFMMGPMSVAQYLEQGAVDFDMVVMDEASQLRPEEALGAVARGQQLIVVGDPKQLPPTNFFDRLLDGGDDEDDDAPAVITGSESILDICQQLFHPIRTLRWHYRSQHESLIAFSNHHFYNQQLLIFPSPFERNSRLGVRYHYIRNGIYKDRQNVPEALRVVDAVIDHMLKHLEESLGVVTLNLSQRDLIEDLLDKKLRNIEEAQTFISNWQEQGWPFFVKNLENVQGDERDVIFISTTFGKVPGTDKVRQNFGPISRPDGWRRLNVLFTRARQKLALFTSMLPEDVLLEANTPLGTRSLKDYLDFAKRGVLADTTVSDREPDSDFEIAVLDMLQNRGYEVVPQLGVAGFFIDLAVRNRNRPGEFLAAIECDGAKYHSSNSARDRDRIRQEILESLGWKNRIWRIWSTDWFYNPRRELDRLLAFLQEREEISASEPTPQIDPEIDFEEIPESKQQSSADTTESTTDPDLSISEEELYVEVGDTVTYCFVDKANERCTVVIVDGESNPQRNLTNENSPLAKALLNCAVGDEPEVLIKDNAPRAVRVLKIQRQQNLWNLENTAAPEQAVIKRGPVHEPNISTTSAPLNSAEFGNREPEMLRSQNQPRGSVEPETTLGGGIMAELRNLDTRFENPRCTGCGGKAHLAINNEGPVVICESGECKKFDRVDIRTLQRLADLLGITCFQCKGANLSSQTGKFSNYLRCHDCNSSNSWQGISTRLGK